MTKDLIFSTPEVGYTERELPSSLLWIRVLVAQHADRCGDTAAAMEHIDAALEHTPTLIELFIFKARFFKHAGDPKAASEWMEQARELVRSPAPAPSSHWTGPVAPPNSPKAQRAT